MSGAERRVEWLEPLPTVELADRLRRVALFDYLSVDELFRFAGTARQVRYDRGRTIYEAGAVPDTLQFLLEGEARFVESGGTIAAPSPLAFDAMLEGRPLVTAIQAVDVAVTLSMTQGEFLTLLSDNIDVAHGLFRMLVDSGSASRTGLIRGRRPEGATMRGASLQPMERALVLHASPMMQGTTSAQLLRVAAATREVPLRAGTTLVREGDDPAIYLVVRGELRVEPPDAPPIVVQPGDAVGVYETLADLRAEAPVTVSEEGSALRIAGPDLFEVLADDVELLQGFFSAFRNTGADTAAVESGPSSQRLFAVSRL
jgi:CRP-like cAMP-binding protein